MHDRRQFLLILLTGLAVVVAIGNFIRPGSNTPSRSSPPVTQPLPEETIGIGTASHVITLVAITASDSDSGLLARPLDPTSLSPLVEYTPLAMGHHYILASSSNGRMLAVVRWNSGAPYAVAELHLIDVDGWTDSIAGPPLDEFVTDLVFSSDGRTLFWTGTSARDAAHGVPYGYTLYRYDISRRELSVVVRFPASFQPWAGEAHLLSNGQLAIVGVPTNGDNLSEDGPHVLFIDLQADQIRADIRLEGVKAGQLHEQTVNLTPTSSNDSWQYVQYFPGWAWDMERNLLYVVHANEDRVTMVDLAKGAVVRDTEIRPHQSFLDRLLGLIIPAAEAKGGPETEKHAVLSRDGKRLYVLSRETSEAQIQATTLRVIATESMNEVSRLDGLLADFALTPDGDALLLVESEISRPYGFDMLLSRDLVVLDAETLKEQFRLKSENEQSVFLKGFSGDGRAAYLQAYTARWAEGSGWRDQRSTLERLDLNSRGLVSAGPYSGSFVELVHTVPR